jgi:CRISPR/Cas system-associated endonuclease Cas3-HD
MDIYIMHKEHGCVFQQISPELHIGSFYDTETGLALECYADHIGRCVQEWEKISNMYTHTLCRLWGCLDEWKPQRADVDRLMKLIILSHDYGKLALDYPPNSGVRGYYHEVLGSYLVAKTVKEAFGEGLAPHIAASVILLHHEHHLVRRLKYTGEIVINSRILSDFVDPTRRGKIPMIRNSSKLISVLSERILGASDQCLTSLSNILREEYETADVIGEIMSCVDRVLYAGDTDFRHMVRNTVGGFHQTLILSDVRAAHYKREKLQQTGKERIGPYIRLLLEGGKNQ